MKVSIADVTINTADDLKKVETADLLEFYNDFTGKSTTKFASRAKGEAQVWKMLEEVVDSEPESEEQEEAREGRKVNTKEARYNMKRQETPKESTNDGKLYYALVQEHPNEEVKVSFLAKKLGRTERQIRNSISYLRRRYGLDIESLTSEIIKVEVFHEDED